MKNIIDILRGIGIEVPEDKLAELKTEVAANYKTVADYDKQTAKLDALKERAETAETALKGFDGVDIDSLRGQVADAQKKLADAETNYNKQIEERDFNDALKSALDGIKFTSAAAKRSIEAEIRSAGLKINNGKILGLNDLIEQKRKDDASAFVDEEAEKLEQTKARFTARMSGGNTPTYSSREDIYKIKDPTERQRAIAANINLFKE